MAIFNFTNKQPQVQIDRRRSLDGIPVINEQISCENDQTGRLVINIKLKRGNGLLARFQPPVLERNVRLDEIGGFVFKLIDNQRSTLEIIELFLAKYRVNRREATLSVVDFLKSLVKRGVVSIAIR
ncbi:MAG: PqqD family protein [Kiritimatiellae bacterium]|nr:PqqD family protein [Kiritimatiellia bacterium]